MMILNLLLSIFGAVILQFLPDGGGDPAPAGEGEPKADPKTDPKAPPANGDAQGGTPPAGTDSGDGGEPIANPEAKRAADQAAAARVALKEERTKNERVIGALRPMLEALGIKVEGAEPDPTELAKQVQSWQGKYRQERLTNALHRLATAEGARPEALARYLRGGGELDDLDPEGGSFDQELKSVVQRALTEEPSLKAAAAPPRQSGAEFNGGTGKTLDEQIADAEKAGDYRLSMRLKLAKQNVQSTPGSAS